VNRWRIPAWLESAVRERDTSCIYCRVEFVDDGPHGKRASWEHIVNDMRIVTLENIALCCRACNSSKGQKDLVAWLKSSYCKRVGISPETVAESVKAFLAKAKHSN
jgi:hypothetical protein